MAVFAVAVFGVTAYLRATQPPPSANACKALLPDGAAYALSAEQARNAALISAIAIERGMPARAVTIALATAMQESRLINIDYGDRDSLGLFQQRPSQGWGTKEEIMDPVHATNAFFDALQKIPGYKSMDITAAAQAVQVSAFPQAYAQHESMARAFASALMGHSPAALTCDLPTGRSLPSTKDVAGELSRLTDFGAAPVLTEAEGSAPLRSPDNRVLLHLDATKLAPHLAEDGERASWAVGQWIVSTAGETGAQVVVVGNRIWTNGTLEWLDAAELVQPPGVVLVG